MFYENGVDILSPHFEGNHEHPPIAGISKERWFTPAVKSGVKPPEQQTPADERR